MAQSNQSIFIHIKPLLMIERFREYETLEHTGIVFGDFSLKIEYIFYKNSISASQNLSVLARVSSILRPTLAYFIQKLFYYTFIHLIN